MIGNPRATVPYPHGPVEPAPLKCWERSGRPNALARLTTPVYHALAIFAGNWTNHLTLLASDPCLSLVTATLESREHFLPELKEALKDHGFSLWVDDEQLAPGANWSEQIQDAMQS